MSWLFISPPRGQGRGAIEQRFLYSIILNPMQGIKTFAVLPSHERTCGSAADSISCVSLVWSSSPALSFPHLYQVDSNICLMTVKRSIWASRDCQYSLLLRSILPRRSKSPRTSYRKSKDTMHAVRPLQHPCRTTIYYTCEDPSCSYGPSYQGSQTHPARPARQVRQ